MISFKCKINFKNFRTTFLVLMLVFPWIALEASQEDQSKQNDSVKSFPLFQNTGDLDLKTNIFSFLDLRDLVSISANKSFREIIKSEGFLTATDLKISLPNDTCKAFYSLTYDDIENSVTLYENPAKKIAQLFLELRTAEILNEARKKLGQTIIISGLTAEPVEHLAPTLADIPIMSIFRQRPFHVKADRISLAELRNHEVQPNRRVHINLEDDIVVSEIILPYLKTVENKFKEMLRNHIEKDNLSDTDKIILNGDITGPDTDFKELENFAQNKIAQRLKAYSAIAGKKLEQNPNYKDAVILAIGLELRNSHIYKGYVQKISMFYQSVPNLEDCFIALQNIREISIPNFESEKKSTLMLKKIVDKILTQN